MSTEINFEEWYVYTDVCLKSDIYRRVFERARRRWNINLKSIDLRLHQIRNWINEDLSLPEVAGSLTATKAEIGDLPYLHLNSNTPKELETKGSNYRASYIYWKRGIRSLEL